MTQIDRYEAPTQNGAIQTVQPTQVGIALSFDEMKRRVVLLNDFYKEVMQAGTDYDTIPGTPKPSLFQPGAQLLDAIFGLVPKFEELEGTIRDYDKGFFAYEIRCALIQKQTGDVAAEGIGSCNSMEGRYRWRDAKPTCPDCGYELRMSKDRPEWYCWRKNGGCGATFPGDNFKAGGKVENDDPYTLANTILKMAQKRAHVAATLNATGASRIFTQDVEDLGDMGGSAREAPAQRQAPPPAPPASPQPRPARVRQAAPGRVVEAASRDVAPPEPPADEMHERLQSLKESLDEVIDAPQETASKPKRTRADLESRYAVLCGEAKEWNDSDRLPVIEYLTFKPDWTDDQLTAAGQALSKALDQAAPKEPVPA